MPMVELTDRDITLIRVALLQRLHRLHGRADMQESYDETRALLTGTMWKAREQLHGLKDAREIMAETLAQ